MRHAHKYYGSFCSLLQHFADRRGWNTSDFAAQVDCTVQTLSTYLTGRCKPPLHLLDAFADKLVLTADERRTFLWLALEAYTPTAVWDRLKEAEAESAALKEKLAGLERESIELRADISKLRHDLIGGDVGGPRAGDKQS